MPSFLAISPVRIPPTLELDFDVHAGSEVELHQRVHRLRRGFDDVEKAAMGPDLELLAALLVDVRRAVDREPLDMRGQRDGATDPCTRPLRRVHDLPRAVVQHAVIIRLQADADVLVVHDALPGTLAYCVMLATTPAPTVRPPSRMAKRSCASMAIGAISSTSIVTLSPGITISVPSGSCTTPVTSVVRK